MSENQVKDRIVEEVKIAKETGKIASKKIHEIVRKAVADAVSEGKGGAEASEAFIDDYRWRAGVEAAMSEFDRRTGVKKLRVRGMPAVRFYARMKATGLNILRAGAVRKARRKTREADGVSIGLADLFFHAVKERMLRLIADFEPIFFNLSQTADRYHNLAA